jgi:hypothetical protein
MQAPRGKIVDHIDANRVNNCRFNLRVCTHQENQRNVRKRRGCRSRFKGVVYDKRRRKWCAKYSFGGKHYHLGYFDSEVEAARAYDRAAVECFGIYARVNFPEEWPPERRAEVHAQWQAAQKLRTEDSRRKARGGKKGKKKKAKGKNRKPRAKTPRGKRKTKAEGSRGKKQKRRRPVP